jgi:hypothetical protein
MRKNDAENSLMECKLVVKSFCKRKAPKRFGGVKLSSKKRLKTVVENVSSRVGFVQQL